MNAQYALHSVGGDTDAALAKLAKVEFVVTDCDGTLLYTDKALGERAVASVMRLHEAGVKFTVASSRPGRGMRHIVDALRVDMPYASSYNGSMSGRIEDVERAVRAKAAARCRADLARSASR